MVFDEKLTPVRASEGAAGFDLKAAEDVEVPISGTRILVKTGVYVAIPKGYVGLLIPRSSLSKKGIILTNSVGVIDSDYRGEVLASISVKPDMTEMPVATVKLDKYERFVQLVVVPYYMQALRKVDVLPPSERAEGGFGSTGTK